MHVDINEDMTGALAKQVNANTVVCAAVYIYGCICCTALQYNPQTATDKLW